MLNFEPKDLPQPQVHKIMLGGIAPRPIALVSTLSEDGIPNLTPFSFFNAFGSNPPIIAFSPARRGKDATLKDTYKNLIKSRECVVQSVTFSMVEQISLASTEYPPEINEFEKSGLTPIDSDIVKPKRVKESPFQMECKVRDVMSYGEGGGSANIFICEVLKFHVAEDIFKDGVIHPELIDLVSRMSANFYCRASGQAIFEVEKPVLKKGIGYDNLPVFMKESHVYSANNLGKFGNIENIPDYAKVEEFIKEIRETKLENFETGEEAFFRYQRQNNFKYMLKVILDLENDNHPKLKTFFEMTAKKALEENDNDFAWKTALYVGKFYSIPKIK
ncbi:MAG TPA: flavin reductase family protein [Ignavibacteriaceae bacterium]|nr:flavin reductase family protein [Ignavibacteriaceae bacterium]